MAVREGLRGVSQSLGCSRGVVYTDAKDIAATFYSNDEDLTEFGSIMLKCNSVVVAGFNGLDVYSTKKLISLLGCQFLLMLLSIEMLIRTF